MHFSTAKVGAPQTTKRRLCSKSKTTTITKHKKVNPRRLHCSRSSLLLLFLLIFYLSSRVFIGVKGIKTEENKRRRRQLRWLQRPTRSHAGWKWPRRIWPWWRGPRSGQSRIRRPQGENSKMITQLFIFLMFCRLLLVFAGEEGGRDKGGGGGGGGRERGDGLSSYWRRPKTRRSRKKGMLITQYSALVLLLQYYHGNSDYLCPLISVSGIRGVRLSRVHT